MKIICFSPIFQYFEKAQNTNIKRNIYILVKVNLTVPLDFLGIVKSPFVIENDNYGQRNNNLKERSKFTTSHEHCTPNSHLTFNRYNL